MEIKGSTNLVVAGNWNVSILTPNWFVKQFPRLIKTTKNIPVEFQIGGGGMRFTLEDIVIEPTANRLNVRTEIEDDVHYELIMKLTAGVVEKLPHTPIVAIGHNVSYSLTSEVFRFFEKDHIDAYLNTYSDLLPKVNMNSQQIKHVLAFEDYLLNLTYEIGRKKCHIEFNFHYNVTETSPIQDYIGAFKKNILQTRELIKQLTKK